MSAKRRECHDGQGEKGVCYSPAPESSCSRFPWDQEVSMSSAFCSNVNQLLFILK